MKKLFFGVILVTSCCKVSLAQTDESAIKKDTVYKLVALPKGFTAQIDVVYATVDNWQGRMDIYLPEKSNKKVPIIINIHGGGWNHGVKEAQGGFNTYFNNGFAVANIEYRLTGQAKAPAAIEDTRCALIYLVNNAEEFNIDVNKIIIMGGSAGGHLALMGGLMANNHLFDKNCPTKNTIKVAAIIDKYGITDVWDWAYGPNIKSKSAVNWLGTKATDSSFAASVSPMSYVNKNSPPVLIIHGNADPTVPYQQSIALHQKLKTVGVKTEFITVEGGLHGKFTKEQNIENNQSIIKFINSIINEP